MSEVHKLIGVGSIACGEWHANKGLQVSLE